MRPARGYACKIRTLSVPCPSEAPPERAAPRLCLPSYPRPPFVSYTIPTPLTPHRVHRGRPAQGTVLCALPCAHRPPLCPESPLVPGTPVPRPPPVVAHDHMRQHVVAELEASRMNDSQGTSSASHMRQNPLVPSVGASIARPRSTVSPRTPHPGEYADLRSGA